MITDDGRILNYGEFYQVLSTDKGLRKLLLFQLK